MEDSPISADDNMTFEQKLCRAALPRSNASAYESLQKQRVAQAGIDLVNMADMPWKLFKETIQGVTLKVIV